MDSSFENQAEAGIQGAKAATQNAFNASAANAFSTLKGVEHDITMLSGSQFVGNIGKTAVQIGMNLGKLDSTAGGVADTFVKKGVTGLIKKGARQLLGKSSDASSGASAGTDGTTAVSTNATTTATTSAEADSFADAGSDIFSNVGSSTSGALFKAVNISTDEDDFAASQSNLAASQAGNASSAPAVASQDEGLNLVGGDEDLVGARIGQTAENSVDFGAGPQGGGGGGGAAGSSGGEAIADAGTEGADTAATTGANVVSKVVQAGADGADALSDTLAAASAGSSIFDEVPVAGLVVTGVLALGSELASIFESKTADTVSKIGVQASSAAGFETV
jgi:hypothetical protein